MSKDIMDKKAKSYTHLTPIERGRIEELLNQKKGVRAIARKLGRSASTISEEIKRGTVHQIKADKDVYVYYADTGQRMYEKNRINSVCRDFEEKYSSEFFEQLSVAIQTKPRRHSIDSFIFEYKQLHPDESIPSTCVVYRLIEDGKLAKYDIKSYMLPKKLSRKPRKEASSRPKGTNKKILGKSITERPASVEERLEFGHYEADLVIGGKKTGEHSVLTLVERKTRKGYVRRISSRESEVVFKAMEKLLDELDRKNVKSITFDNGAEFSSMAKLKDVDVYFAHAYASWERGSSENFNGMLREYMPKGKSFNGYSDEEIQTFEDCINNRLRKSIDYQSAAAYYEKELAS